MDEAEMKFDSINIKKLGKKFPGITDIQLGWCDKRKRYEIIVLVYFFIDQNKIKRKLVKYNRSFLNGLPIHKIKHSY